MASHDWRLEMGNMLAAFSRQEIHSLTIIKSAFKESGGSFTPEFKKYFMHASTSRINEVYDQFQVNSMLEVQLNASLTSVANVTRRSSGNGTNGVECDTYDRGNETSIEDENEWRTNASDSITETDDSADDEVSIKSIETKRTGDTSVFDNGFTSISSRNGIENGTTIAQNTSDTYDFNDGPISTGLHEIDESIARQSTTNESYIIGPEVSSDFAFAVEMDESNDSVELLENHRDSTDADDDELSTVKVVLDRLDNTAIAGSTEGKSVAKPLKHKNPHKKRIMKMEETIDDRDNVVAKGGRSSSKQLVSQNQKKCSVCGYVTIYKEHLNRHMRIHTGEKPFGCDRCGKRFTNAGILMKHARTHTGEKPYGCDRCGRSFTNSGILMKHAATHIKEFPFHCKACFRGFSLKTEATDHENHCQQRHYECCLCEKFVTFDKADLTRHMRKHTGIKPFRCEICTKRFGLKQHLKRHLNTVHSRINS